MMNGIKQTRRIPGGFTIMELLVVMSIMGILTTIGVTSYFAAISGMTRRSAVSHFVAAINQAHQLASVQSSKIGVIWYNDSKDGSSTNIIPTYVICKAIGRFSYANGLKLYDEFTPLDEMYGLDTSTKAVNYMKFKGIRIYNISPASDGYSDVSPRAIADYNGLTPQSPYYDLIKGNANMTSPRSTMFTIPLYGFQVKTARSQWSTGDPYGIAVSEPMMLPKNIIFSALGERETTSGTKSRSVWFYPDGHCDSRSVTLKDTQQNKSCNIRINNDGTVTYGKW